ncbi:hypothetical protein CISG_07279 [Coccidioides immitis RMSCC 3703]|uniref:Uncharacterized protein n=1 Tax=Coccidioides immitis RMSCC 3703 TaxID=454286 RepID=A0A0J8R5Y2_COCIT|nr:hypothetical protein CISG_07279 [Coccidioides immitis RMSCC 3703]
MNCPSRTEHDPDRPDWNQNPPVLSPDLTARQDLNGRINATQFRELSSHFSSLGFAAGADEGPEKGLDVPPGSKHRPPFADAKLPRDYYEGGDVKFLGGTWLAMVAASGENKKNGV